MTASLTQTVVKLVEQRAQKCATVDDLHPLLPDFTRRQVIKAMQNAKAAGWLRCDGKHVPRRGEGAGRGSAGATYYFVKLPAVKVKAAKPVRKPKVRAPIYARRRPLRPMVSSVFELGAISA